jgi:hypothetical protein
MDRGSLLAQTIVQPASRSRQAAPALLQGSPAFAGQAGMSTFDSFTLRGHCWYQLVSGSAPQPSKVRRPQTSHRVLMAGEYCTSAAWRANLGYRS